MNRLIPQKANLFDLTHALRDSVLGSLKDADLQTGLGGDTLTLHRLLCEQGEIEAAYTRMFQGHALTFDLTAPAGLDTVQQLQAWFGRLDTEMWSALEALSDADLERPVERGQYAVPLGVTFYTYRESVFIFAAKASLYLRALGYGLPKLVKGFVG